jgi:hypothetical protein
MTNELPKIGPTGEHHPRGKLRPDDAGGLDCAVSVKDGMVFLDFGAPVTWLALSKDDTLALVRLLIDTLKKEEIK